MKFPRHRLPEVGVNLTPLIDVVFLLLIFFMVSTTFIRETHLSIELPEAGGEASAGLREQIEIAIDESGGYSINARPLADGRPATLRAAIQRVSGGDTSLPMVISADARTPHQAVVTAMDAAGQMGFIHLRIATRQAEEERP